MAVNQGIVQRIQDTIIICVGLENVFVGELVSIINKDGHHILGYVFDIDGEYCKIVILWGNERSLTVGNIVTRTYKSAQTRAGIGVLGQIINPLGMSITNTEGVRFEEFMKDYCNCVYVDIEADAPGITQREPVRVPLYTGCVAADCFFPIGRGQRELIIGDNKTGKTTLALTAIINQRENNNQLWPIGAKQMYALSVRPKDNSVCFTPCIYVAVGQKRAEIVRIRRALLEYGALYYTCIVYTAADQLASLQYLAPYSGCAIGEWFRTLGYHVLIVYDDLTQHAIAYRQLSLLLRRPPAREAYPSDIFYLHSRLLERAAQVSNNRGGGSLTALPIIETQLGDISAYVATNVISITDGQLFLSRRLVNLGQRPGIDFGLSVSRVGASAQVEIMSAVSKLTKIAYAEYRHYLVLDNVSSDLPHFVRFKIARGKRVNYFMCQRTFYTYPLIIQVVGLYLFSSTALDGVEIKYTPLVIELFTNAYIAKHLFHGMAGILLAVPGVFNAIAGSTTLVDMEKILKQIGVDIRNAIDMLQTLAKSSPALVELLVELVE